MVSDSGIYDSFALVLTYPDADFNARLEQCLRTLAEADADLHAKCQEWATQLRSLSPEDREEVYAHSFDMSPKCTLELGWHLFGESYDRGSFLVWMRGKLRSFSLEETTDLPDHVGHVLPVLGRMETDDANKFSSACVLPAMEIVRHGLKDRSSPYTLLVDTVCTWLESCHGPSNRDTESLPILNEQHEELLRAETM